MSTDYSVLISVYIKEHPSYLKASIDSILEQTLTPSQIVLVQDGPLTKELEATIGEYVQQYPTLFTIVPLEKNLGLGLALNEGLRACVYEYVARMDTDDIAFAERCEKQINYLNEHPEIDIVGSLTYEFHETIGDTNYSRVVPETHNEIIRFSKHRSPFNHPTVMYRKSAVLKVGAYKDILRNEDLDLFLRMLQSGAKGYNFQEPLLYFRADRDNLARRKTWTNCKNYIIVMNHFRKTGYISMFDYLFVVISQLGIWLAPEGLLNKVSNKYLRKEI